MKRILAAIDFSEVSDAVIAAAAELARAFEGEVTLMHAAAPDPDFVGLDVGPQHVREGRARTLQKEKSALERHGEELRGQGIAARALIFQGATIDTLLRESLRMKATLIVVGSHGHGAIARALLGSVSHALLAHAPCPVLVVPSRAVRGESAPDEGHQGG